MATITEETIQHVATLARLKLSKDELTFYKDQLGRVIEYFEQMDQLADQFEAGWRADTIGQSTPERPDAVVPSFDVNEVMAQAPSKVGTAFQVPIIIE